MRKSILLMTGFLMAWHFAIAQASPVTWSFRPKKISDSTYEIALSANSQSSWHIYSQYTPAGGPVPTKFTFNKNPLFVVQG
jgi:hypothetical protein